jgi:hypothetical protein
MLGFLCVDARRERVFSEEFDYYPGVMVADVLAPFLADFHSKTAGTARGRSASTDLLATPTGAAASARIVVDENRITPSVESRTGEDDGPEK